MSVGPVPNLSGGLSTPLDCCSASQVGGNGGVFVQANGAIPADCNCNGSGGSGGNGSNNNCCSNGSSGGGNGGGGGGNGSCGSTGIFATGSAAGPLSSPPPGGGVACLDSIEVWGSNQCGCYTYWTQDTPANLPYGSFLPIPPANASPAIGPPMPACSATVVTPDIVLTGAPTPPAVPNSTAPYTCNILLFDTIRGSVVRGIPITCLETGVTLTIPSCETEGGAIFYVDQHAPVTYHFTTPETTGQNCDEGPFTYLADSTPCGGAAGAAMTLTRA